MNLYGGARPQYWLWSRKAFITVGVTPTANTPRSVSFTIMIAAVAAAAAAVVDDLRICHFAQKAMSLDGTPFVIQFRPLGADIAQICEQIMAQVCVSLRHCKPCSATTILRSVKRDSCYIQVTGARAAWSRSVAAQHAQVAAAAAASAPYTAAAVRASETFSTTYTAASVHIGLPAMMATTAAADGSINTYNPVARM